MELKSVIRRKNVLTMLCIAIMHVVIIIAYYQFYVSDSLTDAFQNEYDQIEQQAKQIKQKLEETEDIAKTLDELVRQEDISVVLTDEQGQVVYEKEQEQKELLVHSEDMIRNQGKLYILKIAKHIDVLSLHRTQVTVKLMKVEIILIFVILLLVSIYTHLEYLNPIVSIQNSMRKYKTGVKPTRSTRKDEFGYLQNTFVDITENLEEERQKQDRMIASISHDIKTPLTSVMGYSEKINKGGLDEEKLKKYVGVIYHKANSIKNIIDDFDEYLNYHLKSNLKKDNITVQELLNIIKADYNDEFENKDITFMIKTSIENEKLNVDIEKMRRVFANIIGNSIKHLTKAKKQICIEVVKRNNKIRMIMADNGTGVEESELDKIFEALYTEDTVRKVSGLGLSICKEIVEAHEGKIWAQNNIDGGLSIIIEL